jgi:nitrous oxidase accessory protein NosD
MPIDPRHEARGRTGAIASIKEKVPTHSKKATRTRTLRWPLIAGLIATLSGVAGLWLVYIYLEPAPSEIIRYAKRRLSGHPTLEFFTLPLLHAWRVQVERPVADRLPSLGKGQQAGGLQPQAYLQNGQPIPSEAVSGSGDNFDQAPRKILTSMDEIEQALRHAQPGQVLEILPGTYFMSKTIQIAQGGLPGRPIVVIAKVPGSVVIESTAEEGFHVNAPFWVFENLVIRGKCREHSQCEHAFHVVGNARGTVIRNNRIEDFNAHIKVNGLNGVFPDNGLIQYNTLTNSSARATANPVTPIDIVAASNWQVVDSHISNFIKGDGNQISFGVFMKGGGRNGHIERNLIIGTLNDVSQPGIRVGLSFGGGGTDVNVCRDKQCITEHSAGIAANNIVAHCNDFGIYVNASNQSLVAYNTLINTSGIDVRFTASSAVVYANLLDGLVRSRDGAQLEQEMNIRSGLRNVFADADQLDLTFRRRPVEAPTYDKISTDFCMHSRAALSPPGALDSELPCRK